MLTKTRGRQDRSTAPQAIPDTIARPASDGTRLAREPDVAATPSTAQPATPGETRSGRFRRKAHRTRLHGYAIGAVALVAFLIALAATNTAHVKVSWVFGTSHVSLVWLVLFAAILGYLLGLVATAAFRRRTRSPRRGRGATS
jgi:uncharacterized integral membrane protein